MVEFKFSKTIFLLVLPILVSSCGVKKDMIAYSSKELDNREIYLTNTKGETKINLTNHSANDGYPEWSPNGKHIAFYSKYDGNKTWSIHTMNSDGSNRKRLTHEKNTWDSSPAWSLDGTKIVFAREYRDSEDVWHEEIWMMDADGNNKTRIKPLSGIAPSFLKDGRILFHSKGPNSQICIANGDGSNIITITNNNAEDWQPRVSPNGKQIVFVSNRDGSQEVFVMNIDGSNQKRLTFSEAAKWHPCWVSNGSKILFASETERFFDLYLMNKDGSQIKKIIDNGSQPSILR